jgi:hypothetical protein
VPLILSSYAPLRSRRAAQRRHGFARSDPGRGRGGRPAPGVRRGAHRRCLRSAHGAVATVAPERLRWRCRGGLPPTQRTLCDRHAVGAVPGGVPPASFCS